MFDDLRVWPYDSGYFDFLALEEIESNKFQ